MDSSKLDSLQSTVLNNETVKYASFSASTCLKPPIPGRCFFIPRASLGECFCTGTIAHRNGGAHMRVGKHRGCVLWSPVHLLSCEVMWSADWWYRSKNGSYVYLHTSNFVWGLHHLLMRREDDKDEAYTSWDDASDLLWQCYWQCYAAMHIWQEKLAWFDMIWLWLASLNSKTEAWNTRFLPPEN